MFEDAAMRATPRNVIIQYEQAPARVVRNFQRLGVSAASPAAYVQTYGASLLDGSSLVATARSAGVVEDISAPGYVGYGLGAYGQEWSAASGLVGGTGLYTGGVNVVDGGLALAGWNGNLAGWNGNLAGWNGNLAGWNGGLVGWNGNLAGWNGNLAGWNGNLAGWNSGLLGSTAVVNGADAAFLNADTDYNGSLDRAEFHNLLDKNKSSKFHSTKLGRSIQKLCEDTLHSLCGDSDKHVGVTAELCNKIINHCHSIMNRYIVEDNHLSGTIQKLIVTASSTFQSDILSGTSLELDGFLGEMEDDYREQEEREQEREQ
ncbi:unnamed protein product [Rotaria sp. Silwood1]|nr:unnamed protein product [Rotaria sp. Silwood1]